MKNSLFARPNLKLFLLGALVLVLVHDLFLGSEIQASARSLPVVGKKGYVTEDEFLRLLKHVMEYPSSDGYMRLSFCYQQRGQLRQAMNCLVRANRLQETEDTMP